MLSGTNPAGGLNLQPLVLRGPIAVNATEEFK
jgi:hypothetical protein